MRGRCCVPMMALCLLLTACGGTGNKEPAELRSRYANMSGCSMETVVCCEQKGLEWEATLACTYVPGGESTVEVLAPETIAGVKAVIDGETQQLEYDGAVLNVGRLSSEELSPAACLPQLMDALRSGWLLEENEEVWNEIPCLRLCVDQTGEQGGKIVSTIWLRLEDAVPLRAEMAVDGEIILTAEFTNFTFCDTVEKQ